MNNISKNAFTQFDFFANFISTFASCKKIEISKLKYKNLQSFDSKQEYVKRSEYVSKYKQT